MKLSPDESVFEVCGMYTLKEIPGCSVRKEIYPRQTSTYFVGTLVLLNFLIVCTFTHVFRFIVFISKIILFHFGLFILSMLWLSSCPFIFFCTRLPLFFNFWFILILYYIVIFRKLLLETLIWGRKPRNAFSEDKNIMC